jgi:hypothetical protein
LHHWKFFAERDEIQYSSFHCFLPQNTSQKSRVSRKDLKVGEKSFHIPQSSFKRGRKLGGYLQMMVSQEGRRERERNGLLSMRSLIIQIRKEYQ